MNSSMGLMTAITIGLALVIDFLALPPLLIWLDGEKATKAARRLAAEGDGLPEGDLQPIPAHRRKLDAR